MMNNVLTVKKYHEHALDVRMTRFSSNVKGTAGATQRSAVCYQGQLKNKHDEIML